MLLPLIARAMTRLLRLAERAPPIRRDIPPEWFKFPMY